MTWVAAFLLSLSLVTVVDTKSPGEVKFVVSEAPLGAELTLHRTTAAGSGNLPVFASVLYQGDTLTLTPTYSLSPGETYEARVTTSDGKISERKFYHHPAPEAAAPRVIRVLPDTGKVPANLLKFYLEFDQPMREGIEIFDKIHLIDLATHTEVDSPWRRQELWSPNGKRLTLWIHPGRIKQGVNLRTELGPVLFPDRKYELILDETIQTPDGRKLEKSFRHTFETTAEDRTLLDMSSWEILAPQTPRSPLVINTKKALDPWLATRHMVILHHGKEIPTTMTWDLSQTRFELISEQSNRVQSATQQGTIPSSWISGDYSIRIDEFLEDLAGNTALRVFDTDLSKDTPPKNPTLERDFTIPLAP